jgi:hypothetical protein
MNGLALGCSHTAGVGVDPSECYVSLLAKHYNIDITNAGVPGGNANHNIETLVARMRNTPPKFVIAQWPNPARLTVWHGDLVNNENVNTASVAFRSLLAAGEKNFILPWLQNIITADTLCKLADVPVVHILLENLDLKYVDILNDQDIELHMDLKLEGRTWLFDSQGSDNLHHSARCHAQWAERLIGLLDEITTR